MIGRVRLNRAGMQEMLTSPGVKRAVEAKAAEIAARARAHAPLVDGEPGDVRIPVTVEPAHGRTRARALVVLDHPSGEAVESKHRTLGSALG